MTVLSSFVLSVHNLTFTMATTASPSTDSPDSSTAGVCRVPLTQEQLVRVLTGTVSLIGLGLGFFLSLWGYLLTVFAGLTVSSECLNRILSARDVVPLVAGVANPSGRPHLAP